MNILILEDEIPAFEKLLKHLEEYFKNKFSYDWARTVSAAKEHLLQGDDYDLILSDIELLDGTSFDLFKEAIITCPIIFCSAYDEYLFEAFNSNGIAYVLKPYSQEDLNAAFTKYNTLFQNHEYKELDHKLMNKFMEMLLQKKENYKERFVIKTARGVHLLTTADVSLIEAAGTFCKLIDHMGKTHLLSQNIGALTETLNPRKFFRINRSQIVSIDFIESMEIHFKNRLLLQMKGTKEKVLTSSSVTARFRTWLETQ